MFLGLIFKTYLNIWQDKLLSIEKVTWRGLEPVVRSWVFLSEIPAKQHRCDVLAHAAQKWGGQVKGEWVTRPLDFELCGWLEYLNILIMQLCVCDQAVCVYVFITLYTLERDLSFPPSLLPRLSTTYLYLSSLFLSCIGQYVTKVLFSWDLGLKKPNSLLLIF